MKPGRRKILQSPACMQGLLQLQSHFSIRNSDSILEGYISNDGNSCSEIPSGGQFVISPPNADLSPGLMGHVSHPAAAAPPARSGTFSAGVLAKVGKPETLPGWVQICGRKLNSISPQVLLGKHAFSLVSISFSFSVLLWSAFTLFKMKLEPKGEGQR